jgi:hypothetical protein
MIGAHDLFVRFTVFDSGMYDELCMRIRQVVQRFRVVVF